MKTFKNRIQDYYMSSISNSLEILNFHFGASHLQYGLQQGIF